MNSKSSALAPKALPGAHKGDLTYVAFLPQEAQSETAAKEIPPLPDLLNGRYHLERVLGVGGMGVVYRARDLLREQFGDPQPAIAIKLLSDELAELPDASALLYSEFALTVRLHHPHIVRLHNFEVDNACRRAFLTMELMRGPTLDQVLCDRPQGLNEQEFFDIALPLLDALHFSHQQGVLHGDLKPSNVVLLDAGPKLFDYGLGQAQDGLLEGLPKLSRDRFKAWTPRYAALELLEGAALTPACDLFAIACVFYELLSGHHPYRRLNARQAKSMQLENELQPPTQLLPHAWDALRTALSLEEHQRQISISELRAAFCRPKTQPFWVRWFKRDKGLA